MWREIFLFTLIHERVEHIEHIDTDIDTDNNTVALKPYNSHTELPSLLLPSLLYNLPGERRSYETGGEDGGGERQGAGVGGAVY